MMSHALARKALGRLVDAVDAIRKPHAINNVYACMELHEANNAVRELLEGPDLPVQVPVADPSDMAYTKDITVNTEVSSDDEDAFAPWG